MTLATGQVLQGRYRILRLLGQGGMGAVYLAEDTRLGRPCALKENVPDPNADPQVLAQIRQQFQVEARTLAGLDHPNLPKVYDFFSDGGNEYIVMEYVEGDTLAALLQRQGGPLPEKPVLLWADQVLDALEYLHGQQPRPIIHRDIKPSNIILTARGRIKLVDFGLVKLFDPSNPRTATAMRGMGTPEYAPLEQYGKGAGHTDARSDIYSLGATLYHLLTNTVPPEVTQRILDPRKLLPPRQHNPALSPATEAAVLKAMEVHPDQRFQTAREMRQALAGARAPVPQPGPTPAAVPGPKPKGWLIWGSLALGVVLIVAFLVLQAGGFFDKAVVAPSLPVPTPASTWPSVVPATVVIASPTPSSLPKEVSVALATAVIASPIPSSPPKEVSTVVSAPFTPVQPSQEGIHVVKLGETLFSIALKYGVTVEAIMQANGLDTFELFVGQELVIPSDEALSATPLRPTATAVSPSARPMTTAIPAPPTPTFGATPATPTPSSTSVRPTATAIPATPTATVTSVPPTAAPSPRIGSTMVSPVDGMTLVYVPAGEFLMGSAEDDSNADSDERPQHKVYLDAFWIDRTEVTNAMFAKFVASSGYRTDAEKAGKGWVFDPASKAWKETAGADWQHPRGPGSSLAGLEQHPVVQVSWNDAAAYCAWAGRRLPTEAEWEKAARGTDGRKYPWGNQGVAGDLLNFADRNLDVSWADRNVNDGYQFTAPVGSYPKGASPYGALDMAGNVWEWVADWYDEEYYASSPARNPTGPAAGEGRVVRGGSWFVNLGSVRAAYRNGGSPDLRLDYVGFRCALSP